jgi:hypothetical protein
LISRIFTFSANRKTEPPSSDHQKASPGPRPSKRSRRPAVMTPDHFAEGHKLEHHDPEAYKAFLLAVGLGLRRKEIDLLEWPSFRWSENVLRIEPTRHFHPKSENSNAELPVDPEFMDVFRKYFREAKGSFCDREPSATLTSTAASVFSLSSHLR